MVPPTRCCTSLGRMGMTSRTCSMSANRVIDTKTTLACLWRAYLCSRVGWLAAPKALPRGLADGTIPLENLNVADWHAAFSQLRVNV